MDIYTSCLQSTPAHLSVESKVAEARVTGKPLVFVHQEMSEVIASCDWMDARSREVSTASGEEGGEGTRHVALGGELTDRCSSGWPGNHLR